MKNKFWHAVFALVGTTMGAGIFGLPYVFAKVGFFFGLAELLLIGLLVLVVQLMVGEVALRTQGRKRLLGFAKIYLGKFWHHLLVVSVVIASVGTLLAYLILAGEFISILSGVNPFWSTIAFFVIWFFTLLFKARNFGKAEFYLGLFSIGLIVSIVFLNLGYIRLGNLTTIGFHNSLLLYGVVLFAITGTSVIPEMEDILGESKNKLKKAIVWGTIIPVLIYILFVLIVVGVSGALTTQDAISGLALAVNSNFILLVGALIGFVAVAGAALSYGIYFKETLWYDLKIGKLMSWIMAGGLPLLLFLFDIRNFIKIIGLVGAITLGFQLIAILMMHRSAQKKSELEPIYKLRLPGAIYWLFGIFLFLGAAAEVWYSLLY